MIKRQILKKIGKKLEETADPFKDMDPEDVKRLDELLIKFMENGYESLSESDLNEIKKLYPDYEKTSNEYDKMTNEQLFEEAKKYGLDTSLPIFQDLKKEGKR